MELILETLSVGVVYGRQQLALAQVEMSDAEYRGLRKLIRAMIAGDKARRDLGCHTTIKLEDGTVVPVPGTLEREWHTFEKRRARRRLGRRSDSDRPDSPG